MQTAPALSFHCSSCSADDAANPAEFVSRCRAAEAAGFDSIHIPRSISLPDALELAVLAGSESSRLRFRVGWEFAGILASLRGSDVIHAWDALGGRLILHLRIGADDFGPAVEFVANCRAAFGAGGPAFDVEGESAEAAFLAIQHAVCLWRRPHRPHQVHADALPVLHFGKEVGLATAVIVRESQEEAFNAANALLGGTDPASWITPELWRGVLPQTGEAAAALVGAFDRIAAVLDGFKKEGISRFLIRELPGQQDAMCFAARVLPLIRRLEAA